MKISYAIPVCNERKEIEKLVSFLTQHKRKEDEIVVLFDNNIKNNGEKTQLKNKIKKIFTKS